MSGFVDKWEKPGDSSIPLLMSLLSQQPENHQILAAAFLTDEIFHKCGKLVDHVLVNITCLTLQYMGCDSGGAISGA